MQVVDKISRFGKIVRATHRNASALFRAEASPEGLSREFRHQIMHAWARELLSILRVEVKQIGAPSQKPTLFVGNHMSYLDIPLLMAVAPTVFVAKKELAKWPVFGRGMRSVGTVFVDRGSTQSRKEAAEAIAPFIIENQQSVSVFPSGTTKLNEDKPWRWGAFLIAKRHGIPVQPFRLRYEPLRATAYIGDDFFPSHLWALLSHPKILAEVEFHEPILVGDPEAEALRWWNWTREKLPASPTQP
jgi:lyso-ornithine lipid O-acyltransferase